MNTLPPPQQGAAARDEEYSLPCAEALLAGTLALMTGWAQACCDSHREPMARKIVANLQNLAQLEALTPHFRTMLWSLQTRWVQQCTNVRAGEALVAAEARRALWHSAPEALQ
ncbi:MAG: hypothetical protein J7556_07205 [Acidovorax sp.]|nr:hypothetical protein [Acidovorax sp.]